MNQQPLTLNEYQLRAIRTDRTKQLGNGFDLPVLGLIGEIGSLLSEVKKKQRDSRSYLGYETSVVEEMGDALWYLAVIADHGELPLGTIAATAQGDGQFDGEDIELLGLQPQPTLPLHAPTAAFERTLLQLTGAVGRLAEMSAQGGLPADRAGLLEHLASIFRFLLTAANEAGITLHQAAAHNLNKAADRWPEDRSFPTDFDKEFPLEEQLPKTLEIEIFERTARNGKTYVVQKCNGLFIGDRLTDNIMKPDDYRFHDAFHYAYAAILGWTPVTRALFRQKRKSETQDDEGQYGARAIVIEEGVATYVFGEAKQLDFFEGQRAGDLGFTFLKSVRKFVRGYESEDCPLWLWEEAILKGNEAFRFLKTHRRGRLMLNRPNRNLLVESLP